MTYHHFLTQHLRVFEVLTYTLQLKLHNRIIAKVQQKFFFFLVQKETLNSWLTP